MESIAYMYERAEDMNNIRNDIKQFLKQQSEPVEAKLIYKKFDKLQGGKYPHGTVSGGLKRLVDSGEIAQPSRGLYTNMNSKNVFDDLKNELEVIVQKYRRINWPIIKAMPEKEQASFLSAIETLDNITKQP